MVFSPRVNCLPEHIISRVILCPRAYYPKGGLSTGHIVLETYSLRAGCFWGRLCPGRFVSGAYNPQGILCPGANCLWHVPQPFFHSKSPPNWALNRHQFATPHKMFQNLSFPITSKYSLQEGEIERC